MKKPSNKVMLVFYCSLFCFLVVFSIFTFYFIVSSVIEVVSLYPLAVLILGTYLALMILFLPVLLAFFFVIDKIKIYNKLLKSEEPKNEKDD